MNDGAGNVTLLNEIPTGEPVISPVLTWLVWLLGLFD